VALLDDLSAVARMSSAINFFLGRPLRSASASISGRARGVLQRTGAGRVRGALPHTMPTVPQLRREAAHRAQGLDHGPIAAHLKMLTRHARPTHAGRTEPLAEPSLMAFMAGCSSNGCRKPRVERWRRRGWALWTFGSVHAGTDIGYLSRERGRRLYREAPVAMSRWSSERLEQSVHRAFANEFPVLRVGNTSLYLESEI